MSGAYDAVTEAMRAVREVLAGLPGDRERLAVVVEAVHVTANGLPESKGDVLHEHGRRISNFALDFSWSKEGGRP